MFQGNEGFDHAAASRAALSRSCAIQAEARSVYGDQLTADQCLDRVIAARWPNLPEREAYAAAARRYEIELPAFQGINDEGFAVYTEVAL
jgi:hypothetical protein